LDKSHIGKTQNLIISYVQKPLVVFLAGGVSQSIIAYKESKEIAIIYGKSKVISNWIFIKQIVKLWSSNFFCFYKILICDKDYNE